MESSDEEGEIVPDIVTDYYFVCRNEEPVSFSALQLHWREGDVSQEPVLPVFLCGSADDGLRKIYKRVIAWKFELFYALPEIYVLSKEKMWIKLHKPRKCYEHMIRTLLVAVHVLHFVKTNPEESREALWNYIQKTIIRKSEVLPSENDLLDHVPLIKEAMKRDKDVAKSKYIAIFLSRRHGKKVDHKEESLASKSCKFIIEGDRECFSPVCAYCDDGGEMLCCEGKCLRSFHPTVESGVESFCESLGYTHEQANVIHSFLCKNCQYQQHQCFACGLLGSSDKSSGAEVFLCVSAMCGFFYHPQCVAKLLYPSDENQSQMLQRKIAAGGPFTCPVHKCYHCRQVEDKTVFDLQFGICRRCPKAYHRKCFPRAISFECDENKNVQKRARDNLLEGRVLIYCMDHKIIQKIGTPRRDHLIFPDYDMIEHRCWSQLLPGQVKTVLKRSKIAGSLDIQHIVNAKKLHKRMDGSVKEVEGKFRKVAEQKMGPIIKSSRNNEYKILTKKLYKPLLVGKRKLSGTEEPNSLPLLTLLPRNQNLADFKNRNIHSINPAIKKANSSQFSGRAEMERRILALIESSASAIDAKEFLEGERKKSFQTYSPNVIVDKTITMGKVEQSIEAIRVALKILDDGGKIEEAKAVCEPEILHQIVRWKRKLQVYLRPFFHGMRYTSFGRHFTKVDKLKEVTERLRWYVQDGDTVVDFCCGSNDFSYLLKEALDRMGRRCDFRNYDLIHPKNDFNFEKRDWMTVGLGELPEGSKLIMGLNPPFGVRASLANQFINKALTFRPKLLVLIVPDETERLDKKIYPYDLIWEDDQLLSGKSFYLPGSVDVHEKQLEQWNWNPPPLYLWSRPDWTARHREIAFQYGQIRSDQYVVDYKYVFPCDATSNYLMEDKHDCYGDFSSVMKGHKDVFEILDDLPELFDQFDCNSRPGAPNDCQPPMHKKFKPTEEYLQVEQEPMDMELFTP